MANTTVPFTLLAAAGTLATAGKHTKVKIKSINIVDITAVAKTLTFTDTVTTNTSAGATGAAQAAKTVLTVYSPGSGVNIQYSEKDLAGIEILGTLKVSSSVAEATSFVDCSYEQV